MDKLRRTFTGSATSALAALLMVGAITFGATVIRPMSADRTSDATTAQADGSAGHDGGDASEPSDLGEPSGTEDGNGVAPASDTSGHDETACQDEQGNTIPCDGEEPPSAPPADEPKDEPTDEPKDKPASEPAPSSDLGLEAFVNFDLGKIVVEWSAFTGDFEKYKLVRSSDSNATWPLGDGDQLVGVIGPDGGTRFVDTSAPCNTELHYRVFAVRHSGEGYLVLASSNVDGVLRECSDAPPEPTALGFELARTPDGVKLSWEACGSETFVAYKIVRSATNANPTYPLNDGTELIGVIGDHTTTMFVDTNVEVGQTWTYRVLSMGQNGDGWYVLGLTAALSITVE
jgi:hypothetical protein